MKTILTGIRVNSEPTLGNFLGAMLPMVRLANKHSKDHNINIFVPDLHSIISETDGDFQKNLVNSVKYYIASGLKINENVHIYRQSYVPAHSEMCWILNCVATMGELSRMTQFKDKSQGKESVNAGIFDYPVLMASDILLYSASYVPVGEDQFQHLELTRNLAMRVNNKYGEIFVVPEKTADQVKFMGEEEGVRIRDLVNPEKKMSKSAQSENSKIMLSDDPKRAAKKIMGATTDSYANIKFDMFNQPGISNLLQIEALINDKPLQDVIATWNGESKYGDLKKQVASSVSAFLENFQAELDAIPDEMVYELLETGEIYANEVADKKLLQLQKVFKLR
ncbi:tryptophan--tRNA ligase [Candidatus Saccharibacteria bacterium]|nr:tryptophan--tRNA ligase [Candidatus Saccharibacteria bacterium]MBQ9403304.1 tryptophan--tRNA ligase [Candidatus Saccharibacteria bacterium]